MSAPAAATPVTEATQTVVDLVLAHVGAGKGGPHAQIEAELRALVDQQVHDFAVRIREALNQSVYDSMEGEMAARAVLREVLGPEDPRAVAGSARHLIPHTPEP